MSLERDEARRGLDEAQRLLEASDARHREEVASLRAALTDAEKERLLQVHSAAAYAKELAEARRSAGEVQSLLVAAAQIEASRQVEAAEVARKASDDALERERRSRRVEAAEAADRLAALEAEVGEARRARLEAEMPQLMEARIELESVIAEADELRASVAELRGRGRRPPPAASRRSKDEGAEPATTGAEPASTGALPSGSLSGSLSAISAAVVEPHDASTSTVAAPADAPPKTPARRAPGRSERHRDRSGGSRADRRGTSRVSSRHRDESQSGGGHHGRTARRGGSRTAEAEPVPDSTAA
jgi:hypothetical protein